MTPLVLLICEWWRRGGIGKRALLRVTPFAALSLVFGVITLWFQYNRAIGDTVVRPEGLLSRLAGAGTAVWFYLYKAILPVNLSMNYPRWEIDTSSFVAYVPLLLVPAMVAVLWRYRHAWARAPFAAFAYFVIALLPVLGFADIHFMRYSLVADHWQYIPIIGIVALAAAGFTRLTYEKKQVMPYRAIAGGIAVVVLLSALSWQRASVFRDQESLWRDTLNRNPSSWVAHAGLGTAYQKKGDFEKAASHYAAAIGINPTEAEVHANLGQIYYQQGRLEEAETHLEEALDLNPGLAEARNDLGAVYYRLGRIDDAVSQYSRALEYKPDLVTARVNLGAALASQGKIGEAIIHYNEALRLDPNSAATRFNLGIAHMRAGDRQSAMEQYETLMSLDPGLAERLLEFCRAAED